MTTSETPWTPGPWTTQSEDLRGGRYYSVYRGSNTELEAIDIHESENGEADARLIAAAPALYEALVMARIYAVEFIDEHGGMDGCEHQDRITLDKIDAALRSARVEG